MPQSEKKTGEGGKKESGKKAAKKGVAKEKEEPPTPPQLDRDQLESLREKLQRKFH